MRLSANRETGDWDSLGEILYNVKQNFKLLFNLNDNNFPCSITAMRKTQDLKEEGATPSTGVFRKV
jgi:hypothetical protein